MLPEEVRNDSSVRHYKRMPMAETDSRHVLEAWERAPHPDDDPVHQVYHGEWQNVTARYKAEWEVLMAKDEVERLRREALRQERLAVETGRSTLDPPIGRGRRHN